VLAFGRAAAPLLLPLVVVGAAGAIAFPAYVQAALVFGLGLFAWRLIIVPEREPGLAALRRPFSSRIETPFWVVGVPALGAVAVFFVLIRPGDGPFEDRGGLVLLYATIPLWIEAVLLRALGYSTSALRAAVGICLVLFVGCLAATAGIIPGGDWLADNLGWLSSLHVLAALGALLIVAALTPLLAGGWGAGDEKRAEALRPYSALGLVAAVLASIILAAAAIDGAVSARAHTKQPVDEAVRDPGEPKPADDVAPAAGLNNRLLAARYLPVLVLAKGEQWRPIAVDQFVADSTLVNRDGKRFPHPASLPDHCHGPNTETCFRLELPPPCDTGDDRCAQGYGPDPEHPQGVTYFRVLRKGTPHGGYAFAGGDRYTEPAAHDAAILVQYWFFYRYNEWKRPILSGTLAQRHQGDWEGVTLGLSDEATPLFLAYSEHCGGTWRNWDQIETAPGPSRLHPLVAVAKGSHANYVSTDERRSPDWASCGGGLPEGFLSLLSYASNIRDETSFGTEIPNARMRMVRASEQKVPMSFPGTWGANDRTTLENERTHVLKEGGAPATPTYQRLWEDPLLTIFCGEHWDPPSGERSHRCKRPLP
jgi:hypothetical protein